MKWAVIGAGKISRKFANDLKLVPGATLEGVSSRTQKSANAFAAEFGIPAFSSTEELLASGVEVVYIGSTHNCHAQLVIQSLRAGKHVLCEKPLTMNYEEATQVATEAKTQGRFLMEAMWTRFLPAMKQVAQRLENQELGEIVGVKADFGFKGDLSPESRLSDPAKGAGALLDVGVYCVSLTQMLTKALPERVSSQAILSDRGVDETSHWVLDYAGGFQSVCRCSVREPYENTAVITGKKGEIKIPFFWQTKAYQFNGEDFSCPYPGGGFQYQIEEVERCVRAGKLESDVMPLSDTLQVMKTMDLIQDHFIEKRAPRMGISSRVAQMLRRLWRPN